MIPARIPTLLAALVIGGLVVACGGRASAPPEAGTSRGGVPDLRGERVMILPPQLVRAGHPDLERELVFALRSRGTAVTWVEPDALRRRAANTPGLGADIDRLPIQAFTAAQIDRVGDPLFGALYRLGAVEGADLALIPVEARGNDGEGGTVVELSAALIHVRTGRVLWFGIVAGEGGEPGELRATASAAEALARRLVP